MLNIYVPLTKWSFAVVVIAMLTDIVEKYTKADENLYLKVVSCVSKRRKASSERAANLEKLFIIP